MVIEILEKHNIKPEFREMLKHESLIHWADVSKIKKSLGFVAQYSVEESVRQYIEWRLRIGSRDQATYIDDA